MNGLEPIYHKLYEAYGSQGWWPLNRKYSGKVNLNNKERFEVCLGAILTQNTSWSNVNKVLNELRKNNLIDQEKLSSINIIKLASLIKSSGYNNQKAKKIKEFIKFLDSEKEINRENLLAIWGVGEETADSILLYAYQEPIFVIDTYTKRIFSRLGVCQDNISYKELQEIFHENLKKDSKFFNEYHALIVEHAKRYCNKRPLCSSCILNKQCKHFKKSTKVL